MLHSIKKTLGGVAEAAWARRGKTVRPTSQLEAQHAFTSRLLAELGTGGADVAALVFSKDRAMQLHAFLTSYCEQVRSPPALTVLYRASTAAHQAAYDELCAAAGELPAEIAFLPETDFRSQLIEFVARAEAAKVVMFVDDMVFKEPLDGAALRAIDSASHILSLSRGRDLTYSTVLQRPITVPPLRPVGDGLLEFSWQGAEFSDWTFPLGLSGFMYGRLELLAMLRALPFRAPNSLEAAMQQLVPLFEARPGLCFDKATCACIHANMVQTELSNPTLGTFSVEQLLDLWRQGMAIDVRALYGLDLAVAEQATYSFLPRGRPVPGAAHATPAD